MALVTKNFSDIITFTRTGSTATYFNSAGVLTSAAADQPRFDYNPSTLAAQGLLIEEARTNLLTYSALIGGTNWTNQNSIVVTTNTTDVTDPSNTNTASKLVSGSATSQTLQSATLTAAVHSASVFLRTLSGTVSVELYVYLTVSPFTVIGSATVTATSTWQRFSFTTSTATAASYTLAVRVPSGTAYAFGAQLEAGAFPTSYIPTTAIQVTRNADVASVNTLSPWYNQSAGTMFAEFSSFGTPTSFPTVWQLDDGTTQNNLIGYVFTNVLGMAQKTLNVPQGDLNTAGPAINAANTTKMGYAYATNDSALSGNGSALTGLAIDNTISIPTVTTLRLGGKPLGAQAVNGYLRRVSYYPRRLSNAELQALTT